MKRVHLLTAPLLFAIGILIGTFSTRFSIMPTFTEITYEELKPLYEKETSFFLYVHRSSCKTCAIVSDCLNDFAAQGTPLYTLNMENYLGSEIYDEIKSDLGFYYVPCFQFIQNGKTMAHLDNPLPDHYFDTEIGSERAAIRETMKETVFHFMQACQREDYDAYQKPLTNVISGTVVTPP